MLLQFHEKCFFCAELFKDGTAPKFGAILIIYLIFFKPGVQTNNPFLYVSKTSFSNAYSEKLFTHALCNCFCGSSIVRVRAERLEKIEEYRRKMSASVLWRLQMFPSLFEGSRHRQFGNKTNVGPFWWPWDSFDQLQITIWPESISCMWKVTEDFTRSTFNQACVYCSGF